MAWIEPSPKKNPKHKGPWYVRWRLGKQRGRSDPFYDLSDARTEKAKRTVQERESRKQRHGQSSGGCSLIQLWSAYRTEALSEGVLRQSTADQKERMLFPFLEGYRTLGSLTGVWGTEEWGREIQRLKSRLLTDPNPRSVAQAKRENDASLLRPYCSTTVSIILRALQTFLEWCKTKKYIPGNPMEGFAMPRSRDRNDKLHSKDDINTILAAAPVPEFRLYLVFLIYQGLRRSMTLLAEGRQLQNGMWSIPAANTKEGYDVTVPIHPRVEQELAAQYPNGLPKGRLFPFTYSQISWYWRQTKVRAALPYHITIHGLRRTWATAFMQHTQNLKAMMDAGAWKDVKTAMKYQHLQSKWLKKQVQSFDYD